MKTERFRWNLIKKQLSACVYVNRCECMSKRCYIKVERGRGKHTFLTFSVTEQWRTAWRDFFFCEVSSLIYNTEHFDLMSGSVLWMIVLFEYSGHRHRLNSSPIRSGDFDFKGQSLSSTEADRVWRVCRLVSAGIWSVVIMFYNSWRGLFFSRSMINRH